ncbi:D-glycero-alpha-D-manno-heptose-1,7-bisphosphate 7-phosphatase [Ferruginivarius sediminum]|uniref:D,D-heptose 1,7-bisphosphate phosphatase n=1 Tax=Ferruginivarius sediminum TaxID=2661937 RepID=A0A369T6K8_9PROT|nr:HAD-IIIA family hydrolase [Ferruginivarius sediminum]RDD60961.1 HAD-IIIA family hydrolase [Ferruginivarius sediminum]
MKESEYPLVDDGTWCEIKTHVDPVRTRGRPALFLDRDGVVVEEVTYLHRPEEVALIDGAARLIASANAAGLPVVLVTNQSGVGRGYYGWQDFRDTQARIETDLAAAGARFDAVIACPFTPGGDGPYVHPDHLDRKPNPGMLLRAGRCMGLNLAASWIVGDRGLDVVAGRRGGLAGGLHVSTGFGADSEERDAALAEAGESYTVLTADSIAGAGAVIDALSSALPSPAQD